MKTPKKCLVILAGLAVSVPTHAPAQGPQEAASVGAYYRAVGEYFRVPSAEVAILAEWSLPPDEIPVVLFLSRRGGVSADALVAQRKNGRGWFELAGRYGLDAGAFHVAIPESTDAGALAGAYAKLRSRPAGGWGGVTFDDAEVVGLVNLRFLSDFLGVPPARVLAAWGGSRSFVVVYRTLSGL